MPRNLPLILALACLAACKPESTVPPAAPAASAAMDSAPAHVDVREVRAWLESLPGVTATHDMHVWNLSTTETALTAHLVHERADPTALLKEAQILVRTRFFIGHTTLQLETEALPDCPDC